MTDCLPGSVKTFSRDLVLLRHAGVPVIYSRKRKAFLLEGDGFKEMCPPDNLVQTRMLARLRRLLRLMNGMPELDCDVWYRERFPNLSKRTMQRDFSELNALGYCVRYGREEDGVFEEELIGCYYCERPTGIYDLYTFRALDF